MATILRDLIAVLEAWSPPAYQESYDNAGLLVGDPNQPVTGVLVTLDSTEAVVDEAIAAGCNVIVAHHPILFKGLKSLTGKTYVERTLLKAIRANVAIYAAHTNLDHVRTGVNAEIADRLGLLQTEILAPKAGLLSKLVVYVPVTHTPAVLDALFAAGAGQIGAYDRCSFRVGGSGTFRPLTGARPAIGQVGQDETVTEDRLEVLLPSHLARPMVAALRRAHPYEVPAYDLYTLQNEHADVGAGLVGHLPEPLAETEFLTWLKSAMHLPLIRHTNPTGRLVAQVAVCGGAGSFLLPDARRTGADAFVTADYKYHEFFDADGQLLICDIGHYESEVFTKDRVGRYLSEKFVSFAVILSKINTNPVHYFVE
jgi:dinuclear metal center YbgI/SA1388 family protein